MKRILITLGWIGTLGLLPVDTVCWAQQRVVDVDADQPSYTAEELEQLVGPIALYPDPLLAQILPASTYPLDIVRASRSVQAGLPEGEIDQQDWDPSVRAVAHYPSVLDLMNSNLDWTQQLGTAFIAQPDEVMQAVQRLRQRARDLGNLTTTPQQQVVVDDQDVYIVPAAPDVVYVPVYQPQVVYYERPAYEPFISFGPACFLGDWLDLDCDWGHHYIIHPGWSWNRWRDHIEVDRDRFTRFHRPEARPGERPSSVWRRDSSRPLVLRDHRMSRPSDFDAFRGRDPGDRSPRGRINTVQPAPDRGVNPRPSGRAPVPLTPARPGVDPNRARDRGNRSMGAAPAPRTAPAPGPAPVPRALPSPAAPGPRPAPTAPSRPAPMGPLRPSNIPSAPARVVTPPVHVAPPPAARPSAPPLSGRAAPTPARPAQPISPSQVGNGGRRNN